MIPDFDDRGYLPSGVHPATLDEIESRFGRQSEIRQVQMESLRWLIELARPAGVRRLILNGSFTTDAAEPNDVDCVLLIDSDSPQDSTAIQELRQGIPFLDIRIVELPDFVYFVERLYPTDRFWIPKGMVEVVS